MSITTNAAGKIVDTSTTLGRNEFWDENSHRATISKRTFYKRIDSGKFDSFESALTTESGVRPDSVKTIGQINESAEENFFDTFMATDDEMSFGDKKVKAPVGA